MNIKAVIFDIGGVLLDDPQFSTFWQGKEESKELRDKFDTGMMGVKEFIAKGSNLLLLSKEEFLAQYSVASSCTQMDKDVVDVYQKIALPKYIFSDTNPIHFQFCMRNYPELFNVAAAKFLSYEIKLRKDSIESYKYMLSKLEFEPQSLVFIDNKAEYIEKAESLGINGIIYKKGMELRNSLLEFDKNIFD